CAGGAGLHGRNDQGDGDGRHDCLLRSSTFEESTTFTVSRAQWRPDRLLESRPGELRVVQRLQPLAVGAQEEQGALEEVAGVAEPRVERHSRLVGELLSDL